MTPISVYPTIW